MLRGNQVLFFADGGDQNSEIARKAYRYRRDRSRLNDEEESPAVEESPHRRESFAQIDVMTSGLRPDRPQLALTERADNSQQTCHDPNDQQPAGRSDLFRDSPGDNKNAGPNHGSGDDHRRIEQTERSE